MNWTSVSVSRCSKKYTCINMLEHNRIISPPKVTIADHCPNIACIAFSLISKSRNFLSIWKRRSKVMGMEIPACGNMFKSDFLPAFNWHTSWALFFRCRPYQKLNDTLSYKNQKIFGHSITFNCPMRIDILFDICSCYTLLAWSRTIFYIMRVQSYFMIEIL